MSAQLLSENTIAVTAAVRGEARAVVGEAHDRRITGVKLTLDDGSEIALPSDLGELVRFAISGLTQGDLAMRALPDELTSTTAARLIGVSRPTLMKLVEAGELPSHKVGSHHRFAHRDVVALVERRRVERQRAFEELRAMDEALDTNR